MKTLKILLSSVCAAAMLNVSALADLVTEPTAPPSPSAGWTSWLPYLLLVAAVAVIGVVIAVVRRKKKGGNK
jgi:hypothetical protein